MGNVLKASHPSETCTILWGLKWKQRRAVFGSLSRRHLANRNKSQNTLGSKRKKKLFNDKSLVVEEDFLILYPTLYNHLVKAEEIGNCAEISLGHGPRCLLLCRQKLYAWPVFFLLLVLQLANLS